MARRLPSAPGLCALWLLTALATASPARGQSFRGWAGTSLQMVELRPIGVDTVPRADVVTDAQGRFLYQGQEVSCVQPDECTGYLPLAEDRALAATQDLSLTAWGFGMQGLSATVQLRARARGGTDFVWPRYDDALDALLAYAQLQRGDYRVRVGRQDMRSGLGFSAFDGVSAAWSRKRIRFEAYGGRSLARGLREPEKDALSGLDDFYLDKSVYLVGADATARRSATVLTGRYEREITSDRASLVSERASLDFNTTLPRARIGGSLDYDFSFEQVGKGHLTVSVPLRDGRWLVEAEARRYVPYFQLSTIWGFFEPVAYSEITLRGGWSPSRDVGLTLSGGWRTYGNAHAPVIFRPMVDHGWRADASATWRLAPVWAVGGRYQLEWGPGGFLSSIDADVRYVASERVTGSLFVTSFQQIDEFRLGDGRAFGGGGSADVVLSDRWSVSGGVSLLRHRDGGNVFTSPWNQSRAWTSLRVEVGSDPGLANRPRPR